MTGSPSTDAPFGWQCTKRAHHNGPCVAWPMRRAALARHVAEPLVMFVADHAPDHLRSGVGAPEWDCEGWLSASRTALSTVFGSFSMSTQRHAMY